MFYYECKINYGFNFTKVQYNSSYGNGNFFYQAVSGPIMVTDNH